MSEIKPKNPELLTDRDVNYDKFSCCGDEDLVFLRCPKCSHIWVECYECSVWFIDLKNLDSRQQCFVTSENQKLVCPACDAVFEDQLYLSEDHCDKYLATRKQVVKAGFAEFLSDEQRSQIASASTNDNVLPLSETNLDPGRKSPVIFGAIGASIWLFAISGRLASLGLFADSLIPLLSAIAVLITGYWIWTLRLRGDDVTIWTAFQYLLAATALFGFIALYILHHRGVLEAIIDPEAKLPTIANFSAPIVVIITMLIFCIPPIRKPMERWVI